MTFLKAFKYYDMKEVFRDIIGEVHKRKLQGWRCQTQGRKGMTRSGHEGPWKPIRANTLLQVWTAGDSINDW